MSWFAQYASAPAAGMRTRPPIFFAGSRFSSSERCVRLYIILTLTRHFADSSLAVYGGLSIMRSSFRTGHQLQQKVFKLATDFVVPGLFL